MTPRVGYVFLEFPRPSETFLLNEVIALRDHGIPTRIFCLRGDLSRSETVSPEIGEMTEVVSNAWGDASGTLTEEVQAPGGGRERSAQVLESALRELASEEGETSCAEREESLWRMACALRIAAKCRHHGIAHLHCHYANAPAEVGLLIRELAGIPFSVAGHAKDIFTSPRRRLGRIISRASFAVACSEAGARHMRAAAPECAERVVTIHHGIRLGEWEMRRRQAKGSPRVVAVARLTPKKGLGTLVEAVAILRGRDVHVSVEIIGEGRERSSLEDLIERLGVGDRVRLLGLQSQATIRDRFAEATALVLPSVILESNNQDGIANVVLEAMASGLPVVVSDVPALREVVTDGETGLLFPSGNAEDLADRLMMLLGDRDLQRSLASAGRRRVEGLDCADAARQLAQLFADHATTC